MFCMIFSFLKRRQRTYHTRKRAHDFVIPEIELKLRDSKQLHIWTNPQKLILASSIHQDLVWTTLIGTD